MLIFQSFKIRQKWIWLTRSGGLECMITRHFRQRKLKYGKQKSQVLSKSKTLLYANLLYDLISFKCYTCLCMTVTEVYKTIHSSEWFDKNFAGQGKMRLSNMLKICLAFWKSEPQYAYKRYAYKKNMYDSIL